MKTMPPLSRDSLAVVVHGCDRYSQLYPGFEHLFKKYWPVDFPIRYYIITEEISYESDLFTTIKSGNGEWADRLRKGLEQIPEAHIIYFQEDFWLRAKIEVGFLEQLLRIENLIGEKIELVKLHDGPYAFDAHIDDLDGNEIYRLDKSNSDYLLSHAVSLWDKSFLLSFLGQGESPWENELLGSERLRKSKANVLCVKGLGQYYHTVSSKGRFNAKVEEFFDEFDEDDSYLSEIRERWAQNREHGEGSVKNKSPIRFVSLRNRVIVRFSILRTGFIRRFRSLRN